MNRHSLQGPESSRKALLMLADKGISVLVILSLNFSMIRADFMIVSVYFLLYPYLYFTDRRHAINHLLVASVIACGYFYIAHGQYGYNRELLVIAGYNIYPLFAWAVGLFGVYLIYAHWVPEFGKFRAIKKMVFFTGIYWALLFLSEILAYRFFNFRNIATSQYSGLPYLDCIHVPDWMKAFYLLNGPAYFIVCEALRLRCPNSGMRQAVTAPES